MNKQGQILTKEQFGGAPIERAHLHRGFKSKKTPIKWIRFFRACVLQRENANSKRKAFLKKSWILIIGLGIIMVVIVNLFDFSGAFGVLLIVLSLITAIVVNYLTNKKFDKNYTDGYDFFSDYFSAFFTLIEEDLQPQTRIFLEANVKRTAETSNFIKEDIVESKASGFISGKNKYYAKEISKGLCYFNDGAIVSFNFAERIRERIVKKRGRVSGKRKTKYKYKSVYPFTLKMKIPKVKYILNPKTSKNDVKIAEDTDFYIIKAIRKFDVKKENPRKYNPEEESSISSFSVDYFSLEVINLINASYSCVTPNL